MNETAPDDATGPTEENGDDDAPEVMGFGDTTPDPDAAGVLKSLVNPVGMRPRPFIVYSPDVKVEGKSIPPIKIPPPQDDKPK